MTTKIGSNMLKGGGGSVSATWGDIDGDLLNQTDLTEYVNKGLTDAAALSEELDEAVLEQAKEYTDDKISNIWESADAPADGKVYGRKNSSWEEVSGGGGGGVVGTDGLPIGTILPYMGKLSDIPRGWVVMDGSNGTINMTNTYLKGASGVAGSEGGSNEKSIPISALPQHRHQLGALAGTGISAAHTHDLGAIATVSTHAGHSHSVSGTASSSGSHTHTSTIFGSRSSMVNNAPEPQTKTALVWSASGNTATSSAGSHTHPVSGTAASAGAHTHTLSGTTDGAGAHGHSLNGSTEDSPTPTSTFNVEPKYLTVYFILKVFNPPVEGQA